MTARWIEDLLDAGLEPQVVVLQHGFASSADMRAAEVHWIAILRALGAELTNVSPGGWGCGSFPKSREHRIRISRAISETMTPERRALNSVALTGRRHTPEAIAKIVAAAKRRPPRAHSAETREKIRLKRLAYWSSRRQP